jgi:multicomponent Na+:H+ antiporter subunit D
MSEGGWLPALVVASSAVPGLVVFALPESSLRIRSTLNITGSLVKLALVGIMLDRVARKEPIELRFPLLPGFDFVLEANALAMLFVTLSAALWLVTTVYAIAYLEDRPNRSRFFGFFSLCVSATAGIALAGNLVTFLVFYETLTLVTYPLVVHEGDPESLRAGRRYLAFTLTGGAVLLLAIVWLHTVAGAFDFTEGGATALAGVGERDLIVLFVLFMAALGVKTALVPLHSWLPHAMVAPAPVSALLHAVAVVKAGAFGILRVVYEVYGIERSRDLGLTMPLSVVASITIIYGSLRALAQTDLKKRLAYSTVSQLSYIVLGAALLGPVATVGGIVHLIHQGITKITLFFCAGIFSKTIGVRAIRDLDGIGRRMPLTTTAFTVAALGMIGLPPMAGFVTKWYLGSGAVQTGQPWVIGVLGISTVLNAAYFLPLVHAAWFRKRETPWNERLLGTGHEGETASWLLIPTLITAASTLVFGVLAAAPFSPLTWAELIVRREYGG